MKILTLVALLCALPASAVLIEDSPERLVFDVTWNAGTHGWAAFDGGGTGESGSRVINMGNQWSRNPYKFLFEIRWMIDGVFLPTTVLQVSFRTNPEDFSPIPDTVLGSPWLSLHESAWCLPIPGNPHGARIIRGAPYPDVQPVPEGGDSLLMLAMALTWLGAYAIGYSLTSRHES